VILPAKLLRKIALEVVALLAQPLLISEDRTRRVDRVNRVRLRYCGKWRLWGRHLLTVLKAGV
jgi:hypothetical protein